MLAPLMKNPKKPSARCNRWRRRIMRTRRAKGPTAICADRPISSARRYVAKCR
jgi:hypothetical protein